MRKYYDDPAWIARNKISIKEGLKNIDLSSLVKNSENYKKALEEGRVGSRMRKTTKTKEECEKINKQVSESLKKYYAEHGGNKCNIENHREHMAKAKGIRIGQYTKDGKLVATYASISEAARQMKVNKNSLTRPLNDPTKSSKGFLWVTMKD